MRRAGSSNLRDTCRRGIPGYNPWADADGYRFDLTAAQQAVDFFHECLTHTKGELAGKPLTLERWQKAIIGNLFGWKNKKTGLRRYRECLIFVARKNGKSTLAAGIANYILFCDGEPGAEIYSAAAERDQAALVFQQAAAMVHNDKALSARGEVFRRAIVVAATGSVYKPISSDAGTKHGFNTHAAIIDELHVHKTPELVDVLITSTGSRRQPLIIHLTTSDYDRPDSVCNMKHGYASSVRDNVFSDPSFLPVIYEAKDSDDWVSPKTWAKANPNMGVSVSREYFERECKRAVEQPSYENTFKRLHLNIRTQQATRFLRLSDWDRCGDDIDEAALVGRPCFGAFDLSTKVDLTAWGLLFPPTPDSKDWAFIVRFFVPNGRAKLRLVEDKVTFPAWIKQGYITGTPGDTVDYSTVLATIEADSKRFNPTQIAYDKWNAHSMALDLQEQGLDVVEFGQDYKWMSEPCKELEKIVIENTLNHGGNPVLRWMASHVAKLEDPAENIKLSKKHSSDRIDGLVVLVMALGLALVTRQIKSVYTKGRGLTIL